MEYLVELLSSLTDDPDQLQWILTAAVALVIFAFAVGVMFLVAGATDPARRRLNDLMDEGAEHLGFGARLERALHRLKPVILPKNIKESSKIQAQLIQAGFRSGSALFVFFACKLLFFILFPAVVFFAAPFFPELKTQTVIYAAVIAGAVGVFGPNYYLSKRIAKRQELVAKGFADMLDLLVVCVEAGLSFDVAIKRVAEEMKASHPVLSEELAIVNGEIRAGIERTTVLKNLADRTGLEEIRGFTAIISQSIRFGTSMAETLRVYSEDFRDKRVQAAEEQAAKVGTKLIFPLVFCFFPSFFIVALGPLLLKLFEAFGR